MHSSFLHLFACCWLLVFCLGDGQVNSLVRIDHVSRLDVTVQNVILRPVSQLSALHVTHIDAATSHVTLLLVCLLLLPLLLLWRSLGFFVMSRPEMIAPKV